MSKPGHQRATRRTAIVDEHGGGEQRERACLGRERPVHGEGVVIEPGLVRQDGGKHAASIGAVPSCDIRGAPRARCGVLRIASMPPMASERDHEATARLLEAGRVARRRARPRGRARAAAGDRARAHRRAVRGDRRARRERRGAGAVPHDAASTPADARGDRRPPARARDPRPADRGPAAAGAARRRRAPALLRLPGRASADDDLPRRAADDPRRGVGQPVSHGEGGRRVRRRATWRRSSCSPTGRRSRSTTRASTDARSSAPGSSSGRSRASRRRRRSRARSGRRPISRGCSSWWSSAAGRSCARAIVVLLLVEGDRLVAAGGAGQIGEEALAARRCPSRAPWPARSCAAAGPSGSRTSPRGFGIADEAARHAREPRPPCSCRCGRAARSLGVLCAFDRLDDDPEFGDREEELLLLVRRRARRRPWPRRGPSSPSGCATACAPPSRSARAGPASCTTRRCRGSPRSGSCSRRGLRVGGDALEQAARQATDQVGDGDRQPARADHGAAPRRRSTSSGFAAALEGLALRVARGRGPRGRVVLGVDDERSTPTSRPPSTGWSRRRSPTWASTRARSASRSRIERQRRGARGPWSPTTARGFDAAAPTAGFGLAGMRERAALMGGDLELRSGAGGTVVRAILPGLML